MPDITSNNPGADHLAPIDEAIDILAKYRAILLEMMSRTPDYAFCQDTIRELEAMMDSDPDGVFEGDMRVNGSAGRPEITIHFRMSQEEPADE